jgi:hypothetical protein
VPVDLLVADRVAELAGEVLERNEQRPVGVAADRPRGRLERHRLGSGKRLGLRDVEHRDAAKAGP